MSRRETLGLAVDERHLRVVALRGRSVAWMAEAEYTSADSIAGTLRELLSTAPRRGWRKPHVAAAVGPFASQVKRVRGLPPIQDPAVLAQLAREGCARFFLADGVPLVTTGVLPVAPGVAWMAALQAPLVEAIRGACRSLGMELVAVLPSVAALRHALTPGRFTEGAGTHRVEITVADGALSSVRRVGAVEDASVEEATSGKAAACHLVPGLAAVGDDAERYAAAFGAALGGTVEPLRLGGGAPNIARTLPAWRVLTAAAATMLALSGALAAPGLTARHAARQAQARLATLAPARVQAERTGRTLARTSSVLERLAAFGNSRRSVTMLLGAVTAALPKDAALVTFRMDTAAVTVVALTPRAAQVVDALERVPGLASPQILGPVTRELDAAATVERVTVRFRLVTPGAGRDAVPPAPRMTRRRS